MPIVVIDPEKPLNDADLDAAERRLGVTFPAAYRQLLLQHNGGHPVADAFAFVERGKPTTGSIAWFYAIYDGPNENLERIAARYRGQKRVPENLLPIARDGLGNQILLSLGGPDAGSVYFWDHELAGRHSSYDNCHFIAKSLEEFLGGLREG